MTNQTRLIIQTSVLTGLCLGGTLSFPFWYGLILYYAPVDIREQLAAYLSPDLTAEIWLPINFLGGLFWSLALARLNGAYRRWRLCLAGGLGVLVSGIMVTSPPFLSLVRALWSQGPPHVVWIMTLALGIGLGGAMTSLSLGLAVHWGFAAVKLAFGVFLAAALPALIVAFSLDALGIRWGIGNANMAKIAGLAFPAATISAGTLIGWYLARYRRA